MFKVLLWYGLTDGVWKGIKKAFRRKKTNVTTVMFSRAMKELYVDKIREELNRPSPLLTGGFTAIMEPEKYPGDYVFIPTSADDTMHVSHRKGGMNGLD
jgi:hypothetical protein